MDQELEIRKMLEYLSNKVYSVHKVNDSVFMLEHSLGISEESLPRRDCHRFTIDFDNRTINTYSYDESHHNGDHYNCSFNSIPWEKISTMHSVLKSYIAPHLEKEAMDEIKSKLVEEKLSQILKG